MTVGLFLRIPGSFVPPEDQGYIFGTLQLPDGATLERTRKMADDMVKIVSANPGVQNTIGIIGFDLIGGGNKTNAATMFVPLRDWDERGRNTAQVIARDVVQKGSSLRDGLALAFNPAAIRGIGTAGGFEVYVQARSNPDPTRLFQVTQDFMAALAKHPQLAGI